MVRTILSSSHNDSSTKFKEKDKDHAYNSIEIIYIDLDTPVFNRCEYNL